MGVRAEGTPLVRQFTSHCIPADLGCPLSVSIKNTTTKQIQHPTVCLDYEKETHQERVRRASDLFKAESFGKDFRATEGLVSNLPHFWINKTN